MNPTEKEYVLNTLEVLRRYCVEDDVEIKSLDKSMKHIEKCKRKEKRVIEKLFDHVLAIEENTATLQKQVSLLFDEFAKFKAINR